MNNLKKVGIVVGGGPAPGINSVIRAATIKLINHNVEPFGIYEGFSKLMKKDKSRVKPLSIKDVALIHLQGGSILATSRANPTKNKADLENVVASLLELGISGLITIGGDDTCFSAYSIEKHSQGKIQVVHVPKTIDNDLDLPEDIKTFGFSSARDFGVGIVNSLIRDASTTRRWYFVIAMGRKAGHLAFAMAESSGAHLSLIPEQFKSDKIELDTLVDILIASMIKRKAQNRPYGVAIIAEGVGEKLSEETLKSIGSLEYDDHGHPRLSEINLGAILKEKAKAELKKLSIDTTIVDKNIGYELRCISPSPFDLEYTTRLGFSAAKHILSGKSASLITIQAGNFVPIQFDSIMDPKTGRIKVRLFNIESEGYEMALEYMSVLKRSDLSDKSFLDRMVRVTNLSESAFLERFSKIAIDADSTARSKLKLERLMERSVGEWED